MELFPRPSFILCFQHSSAEVRKHYAVKYHANPKDQKLPSVRLRVYLDPYPVWQQTAADT